MKGRARFAQAEAAEIRRILRRVRVAERDEQKKLRAQLRRIGFHISDWDASGAGFTASDFDELVLRSLITIAEADASVPPASAADDSVADPWSAMADAQENAVGAPAPAEGLDQILAALSEPRHRLDGSPPRIAARPGLYAIHANAGVWRQLGLGAPPDERPLYVGKAEDSLVTRDLSTHFGDPKPGKQSITGRSTVRRPSWRCSTPRLA